MRSFQNANFPQEALGEIEAACNGGGTCHGLDHVSQLLVKEMLQLRLLLLFDLDVIQVYLFLFLHLLFRQLLEALVEMTRVVR